MTPFSCIFLDIDGVCADLWGAAALLGRFPHPYPLERRGHMTADDYARADAIVEALKPGWETAIPAAGEAFWNTLEPYPWLRHLRYLAQSNADTVRACTNQGRDGFAPRAAAGKLRWCLEHLRLPARKVVLAADKWLIAAPGRVLIDDSEDNVDAWNNIAPGHAILFPQPWNRGRAHLPEDPVGYVARELDLLRSRAA